MKQSMALSQSRFLFRKLNVLNQTHSVCPVCKIQIEAEVFEDSGQDFLKRSCREHGEFFVVIAAFAGGVVGAKLPVWIMNWKEIIQSFPDVRLLLSGRTIVGGLIGGTLAVEWMKKKLGIRSRTGNVLAAPLALGIAIGRLGCFFKDAVSASRPYCPGGWILEAGSCVARSTLRSAILFDVVFRFERFPKTRENARHSVCGIHSALFFISIF